MNEVSELTNTLIHSPKSKKINELIINSEKKSAVNLSNTINLLTGAWELKWSSSKSLFLNYSPLFDNLQILEPKKLRGLNLIRAKGFLVNNFSTNIFSNLEIIDNKRINVCFKKAGIIGPKIFGKKYVFISEIKKSQKGWLDTTVLTEKLRVCRGYKGTIFALIKRNDLPINEFFDYYSK